MLFEIQRSLIVLLGHSSRQTVHNDYNHHRRNATQGFYCLKINLHKCPLIFFVHPHRVMENHRATRTIKRSWPQRNPRTFVIGSLTLSMLILFSRPIYDSFIRTDLLPAPSSVAFNNRK